MLCRRKPGSEESAMTNRVRSAGLGLLVALVSTAAGAQGQARSVLVASGFTRPLTVAAPVGDARIFVAEEEGFVRIVAGGAVLPTPFLDIETRVSTAGEGGLLGLAFPDDFATSGAFLVYYTDLANDSVISRFSVSADPDVADPASEEVLLVVDQPDAFTNHRAGTIHFGPDGFLWFATGDGGGSNDPNEEAQDPGSLLGKMLRIDVGPVFAPGSIPVAGEAYRIPADNPFLGAASRDEIWALGLRNPFRWSFDRQNGDVWIGDVGQAAREEIHFEPFSDPGGRNYGWDVMEGSLCNATDPAPAPPCNHPSLTLPIHEYDHSQGECSVIGGFVYRSDASTLHGLYFFGDFCTGRVFTYQPSTGSVVDRTVELGPAADSDFDLVSFGEDGVGRLLLVQRASGSVYRIAPAVRPGPGCGIGPELAALLPVVLAWRRRRRAAAP
jgi:glucose/arabinose dehydrogenase